MNNVCYVWPNLLTQLFDEERDVDGRGRHLTINEMIVDDFNLFSFS